MTSTLEQSQSLLRDLDVKTEVGSLKTQGKEMRRGGRALQEFAEDIRTHTQDKTLFLQAQYFQLRGLGYEGEGLLSEALGSMKALAAGLPGKIISVANELIQINPLDYAAVSLAHGIKVQSMITLGWFYFRTPKPLKNVEKSVQLLEEAIAESIRNPDKPLIPIEPVLPRLYLAQILATVGKKDRVKTLLSEVESLLNKPLSAFEIHLDDYLRRSLRIIRS